MLNLKKSIKDNVESRCISEKKLLLFLSLIVCSIANAQPGSLDNTFDSDGKVTTPVGSADDYGRSVAIQSDGKIVVAGYSTYSYSSINDNDFAVVRYNSNGSLDNTFDTDGKVITPLGVGISGEGYSIAIQSNGKIVVAGTSYNGINFDFAVVRYNSNGSLDNTFDTDGKVITTFGSSDDYGKSVAIQSDGKIVVAGYTNTSPFGFAVVRYNSNGSLDNTFDTDGKVITPVGVSWAAGEGYSVVIQSDGKIVVAGSSYNSSNWDFTLVRYNINGSLDSTFNTNGKVITDFGGTHEGIYSVAIQSDGKIVVVGYTNTSPFGFVVVRYNSNGSLDNTFDTDGKVTTSFGSSSYGYSVVIQSDGKIVVAGSSNSSNWDFALVRYNINGSLDSTFNNNGKVITPVESGANVAYSVAIQSDYKIVVAGYSSFGGDENFAVVRYNGQCTPTIFSQSSTVCLGQSITVGSNTYSISGTYIDTLTAFNTCDSIVTTNLTVLPTNTFSQSPTICDGQSLTVGSNTYTLNGIYTDTLPSYQGCDSVVTTDLTVLPANSFSQSPTVCSGQYVTVGSNTYTIAGTYTDTLIAMNGCDSIITTNLTVDSLPSVSLILNPDTVCLNTETYLLTGGSPSGGSYSGVGVSAGDFNPSIAGVGLHNIIYTYSDTNNCIDNATSQIVVDVCTGISSVVDNGIFVFPNPNNGSFTIKHNLKDGNYLIEIVDLMGKVVHREILKSGNQQEIKTQLLNTGIYFVNVKSETGELIYSTKMSVMK